MSDYGAIVTLVKHDNQPVTDQDRILVEQELNRIKADAEFSNVLGEDLNYGVIGVANEPGMLWIRLSEYWHGDSDDENFEFAKDNDLQQAEVISDRLTEKVGHIFSVKGEFENW
jgi:hypothetical protein